MNHKLSSPKQQSEKPTFIFNNKEYTCYHTGDASERAIEIPLGMEILKKYEGKKVLEVGNVLKNKYFGLTHTVVDLFEQAPPEHEVINEDIEFFDRGDKYDLIICISTLEHIGWDHVVKDPEKLLRAFNHMQDLLALQGKLFLTVPLGYNSYLDSLVLNNALSLTEQSILMRLPNKAPEDWFQVDLFKDVIGKYELKLGYPNTHATIILIGELNDHSES